MGKKLILAILLSLVLFSVAAPALADGPKPGLELVQVRLVQYNHKPWLSTWSEVADLYLRQHGWQLAYRYVAQYGSWAKIIWVYEKLVPKSAVYPFVWVPRALRWSWWGLHWGDWRYLRVYTN